MFLLLLSTVFAQALTVSIEADDSISAKLITKASPEKLRMFLANPYSYSVIDPSVTVKLKSEKQNCKTMEYSSAGNAYVIEMCEHKNGFQLDLVQSESIDFYKASWALREAKGGTLVQYKLKVEPKLYVPKFILNRKLKSDVTTFLTAFQKHFAESQ